MCGISGIFNINGSKVCREELISMTRELKHRGPNGEGIYVDNNIGLGHRRLSIIDLSDAAKQPMSYLNNRYWITYNGEIYNFIEIKKELEAYGYSFRTRSDTEVLLASYDLWGIECLSRFNGMWAFAIWDTKNKILILSRDRFGVKPLYYYYTPNQLIFASEVKAFYKVKNLKLEPNESVVYDYLMSSGPLDIRQTIYKNVFLLNPGSWMTIDNKGNVKEKIWWNTWNNFVETPKKQNDQIDYYLALLEDSIKIRLRSDVPIGSLLSGGLDSSSIVCMINKIKKNSYESALERTPSDWQRTYTASYPGFSADETIYSNAVIKSVKLKNSLIFPSTEKIESQINRIIYHHDSPVGQSLFAVHNVYKNVNCDGINVTLDGQGADEALSGYETYTAAQYYLWKGLFKQMFYSLDANIKIKNLNISTNKYIYRFLINEIYDRTKINQIVNRYNPMKNRQNKQLDYENGINVPPTNFQFSRERCGIDHKKLNRFDLELFKQFHYSVLPSILLRFDHAAMSYSIESRMPFLDWRLVSYSFSLPIEQKVYNGLNKVILRKAMRGIVPNLILNRRDKLGFPLPNEWFYQKHFQEWCKSITNDPTFEKVKYWNGNKFKIWLKNKYTSGGSRNDLNIIFNVLTTYIMFKNHNLLND